MTRLLGLLMNRKPCVLLPFPKQIDVLLMLLVLNSLLESRLGYGTPGECSKGMYVLTYEDKEGDWMMVGDVPWE